MLTLGQVASCEGYYLDTETGDVLRNVAPTAHGCVGSWQDALLDALPEEEPRFLPLSNDVLQPFADVMRLAEAQLGRPPSGRVVNRQTAVQPGGTVITEEALIR